jgi:hypothetical protein
MMMKLLLLLLLIRRFRSVSRRRRRHPPEHGAVCRRKHIGLFAPRLITAAKTLCCVVAHLVVRHDDVAAANALPVQMFFVVDLFKCLNVELICFNV